MIIAAKFPFPISKWEVKPVHADGTAVTCGRVGSRFLRVLRAIGGLFFVRERNAGEDEGGEKRSAPRLFRTEHEEKARLTIRSRDW